MTVAVLRPGARIGHPLGTSGTLGFFAWSGPDRVLVSASHILAPPGARPGDPVMLTLPDRPGPLPVAELLRVGAMAAAARLRPGIADAGNAVPTAAGGGAVTSVLARPRTALGGRVAKLGAATGLTYGRFDRTRRSAPVRAADGGIAAIRPAWEIVAEDGDFCAPGDSGALAVTLAPCAALGLLQSVVIDPVGRQRVLAVPAHTVLRALGLDFVR